MKLKLLNNEVEQENHLQFRFGLLGGFVGCAENLVVFVGFVTLACRLSTFSYKV